MKLNKQSLLEIIIINISAICLISCSSTKSSNSIYTEANTLSNKAVKIISKINNNSIHTASLINNPYQKLQNSKNLTKIASSQNLQKYTYRSHPDDILAQSSRYPQNRNQSQKKLTNLPSIYCKAAIVVDEKNGQVLYEKNADRKMPVASIQKLLTALLVAERGNLNKLVTVKKTDTYVEPSKVYIKPGEVYTRAKLLEAMLVKSGNDLAKCLARDNAGSSVSFARRMNLKAVSIGMYSSNFVNPHGLTAKNQYSTARDIARLAMYSRRYPIIKKSVAKKAITFRYNSGRTRKLSNTNKVLSRSKICTGMKTGYTKVSGRTLVTTGSLNGKSVIVVILGSNSKRIWNDSKNLLHWAVSKS